MIEERARVIGVEGGIAEVVAEQTEACTACSAKGGCGTSLLAGWFPKRRLVFRLSNDIGASAGDTVIIGLEEGYLQRGSALLYAVPLVGLLLGAVIGEQFSMRMGHSSELAAVLMGLLGLIGALWLVRRLTTAANGGADRGVRLLRVSGSPMAIPSVAVGHPGAFQQQGFRKYE